MPKHYEDDVLDERGLLRDGARWRTPMYMMDSTQREVATQFADASVMFGDGTDDLAKHKPGQ
jgi:hypothetical protein